MEHATLVTALTDTDKTVNSLKVKKSCERKSSCAYLHRARQVTTEKDDKESTEEEKIKEFEESIAEMTNVIKKKDAEINMSKKDIQKLQNQLERKNVEIEEKDKIIKRLEDEDEYSTDDSDDYEEIEKEKNIKQGMLIGQGHFGKVFQVREGMEEAAKTLRKEWNQR